MWEKSGDNRGSFDASGYDIDHIHERSLTGNDEIDNLQALCKCCHSVKTKAFLQLQSLYRKKKKDMKDKLLVGDHEDKVIDKSENESEDNDEVKPEDEVIDRTDDKSEDGDDSENDDGSDDESDDDSGEDSDKESDEESDNISCKEKRIYVKKIIKRIKKVKKFTDKFICPKCDKEFTSKYGRDYHINKNACKELNYYCKYCDKGFTTETNMYRHARTTCTEKKTFDRANKKIIQRLENLEQDQKNMMEMDHKNKILKKKLRY